MIRLIWHEKNYYSSTVIQKSNDTCGKTKEKTSGTRKELYCIVSNPFSSTSLDQQNENGENVQLISHIHFLWRNVRSRAISFDEWQILK
jgi:hypothetical protein